MFLKLRLL